jgi:hypothetical protein
MLFAVAVAVTAVIVAAAAAAAAMAADSSGLDCHSVSAAHTQRKQ